jgi:hypothetical protein
LIITGKPILLGDSERLGLGINRSITAGRNRHTSLASTIASGIFVPIKRIAWEVGPMNLMLQLAQTSAK